MKARFPWNRILSVLILCLPVVFIFSLNSYASSAGAALELTISFDKAEYKKGETVSADFKLKNTGKKELYVNKRFFIVSEDNPKNTGEIVFSVISPSGEKMPCKVSYEPGFPKTDYFALLAPGQETGAERKIPINYYFDLTALGAYKITAVYHNKYGREIGIDAFRDRVTSKQITIKIVE